MWLNFTLWLYQARMSVKYSRIPASDTDTTTVDFSSIFTYNKDYPKYFSHSTKGGTASQYKSMFTYSGVDSRGKCPDEKRA